MTSWRGGVAVLGAVVVCASCASILGIEEPKPYQPEASGGANVTSSSSVGGGQGGTSPTGTSNGGSSVTSGGGGAGGAGGGVDCGFLDYCPNSTPPCVDTSTDRANCGMCDHGCDPKRACVTGMCITPHAIVPNYRGQLSSSGDDFLATSLSVPLNGAALVVGGTLAGANPFGDGTSVSFRDPFVWQTTIAGPSNGKHESLCHLMTNCSGLTTNRTSTDVAIGGSQNTQLLGDFGLASFDPSLALLNLDAAHPGTGLGLATTSGAQLALADEASVTVFALSGGKPTGVTQFWPLSFSPTSTVPVHVARAGDSVVVAGGLDGPGPISLGDGMANVVGARDAFVGVFQRDSTLNWFKTLHSAPGATAAVTAVTTDGVDVFVVGQYQTSIDTGGPVGPGFTCGVLHAPVGVTQNFVVRYSFDGQCQWARSFGSADGTHDFPTGILEFTTGVLVVGATSATSANFGGQDLAVPSPLFVLLLSWGDGSYMYSWAWGNNPSMQATGRPVGVGTRSDDVWIAGHYTGGPIPDLGLMPSDTTKNTSYVLHFAASQFP